MVEDFDSIVMLTWSDWFKELRSNRYHYATRFAKVKKVVFVQPDLEEPIYRFEEVGVENIVVLHVPDTYDDIQQKLLNTALVDIGCIRPIFWIYNCYFHEFLSQRYSALNVYHATEDYLVAESRIKFQDDELVNSYLKTLSQCQLIITVSDGLKDSLESNVEFDGKISTVYNGCDYSFYCPVKNQSNKARLNSKIAFYQGNIFDKLDYDLLLQLTKMLPDWTFNFCGKVLFNEDGWQELISQPNVNYLGILTPEEIREQAYLSTVGLIPFVQSEWLVVMSFPLKAFEYIASGLPVVSIPIKNLLNFSNVIQFAQTLEDFVAEMELAAKLRWNEEHFELRLKVASQQDYDLRFQEVTHILKNLLNVETNFRSKLSVGILYEPSSVVVSTIEEHLKSFTLFSNHRVSYIPASYNLKCMLDLNVFDVILIHYSIRLNVDSGSLTLSADYSRAVKSFGGYKILFIQDEYEGTNIAHSWITELGIHTVYSCVPQQYKEVIYPLGQFPSVNFITTLTGYVPTTRLACKKYSKPSDRPILIGYRGRSLPYWYGTLGQEKLEIGVKVKSFCLLKNLPVDIEWEESKRIYGEDWYQFLMNCRATLGTESGSNVFDFDGKIRAEIEKKIANNPSLSFEDIYDEHIEPNEKIRMNQVSPKIFEAILLRVALVLFEGEYSDLLIPDVHYIVLKKDFSNLSEVVGKVQDDDLVNRITKRAYTDIIESNQYSYESFISDFDETLNSLIRRNIIKRPASYFFNYFNKNKEITYNQMQKLTLAISPSNFILTPSGSSIHKSSFNRREMLKYKQFLKIMPTIVKGIIIDNFQKGVISMTRIKYMRGVLRIVPRFIKNHVKQLVLN